MYDVSFMIQEVAAGADPDALLEGGLLGPLFRFAIGQAAGYAARKGVEKASSHINQQLDQIMTDSSKDAPMQTIQKLHNLGTHPATAHTPEASLARQRASALARKHGVRLGPSGPITAAPSRAAALGTLLGRTLRPTSFGDVAKEFKKGREGK